MKVKSVETVPTVNLPNKSITYLTLVNSFTPGTLLITAGNGTSFNYTLPTALSGRYAISYLAILFIFAHELLQHQSNKVLPH